MASAPQKTSSSNSTSPGAVVTALCVTLAIIIFICALRMRRTATLAMVQERVPRGCLPSDRVDSIPIAKYGMTKRRYLAGNMAINQPGVSAKNHDTLPQPIGMKTPIATFKDTIQQCWSRVRRPGNTDTTQNFERSVQQSCPTCTEDFLDDDDVRILPCKHLFHPRCIDPWFRRCAITCPLWQVSQLHSKVDLG
ncbi:uncharacterized protein GGS22DRAFT_154986 [Annulohypoxylon maeteangense]|uniref:uncharacterized protein n=1 Tax=Annulohypoxylon maeteangense TaxID=1927788 RepID=UPI002008B7CF|nr:uncharacterized protein GGS22DRAFT_154986 [Annulohypoxylon maeteangense]KAI0888056.1 hypothetical protein GGS22DRAFT_154986 [Annulohypoxylon maeteangense]